MKTNDSPRARYKRQAGVCYVSNTRDWGKGATGVAVSGLAGGALTGIARNRAVLGATA